MSGSGAMKRKIRFASAEDHYRIYESEFVRDLRYGESRTMFPTVFRPGDYNNDPVIRFAPSQNGALTAKEQRELTNEWISFLNDNSLPLLEVHAVTAISQGVFDGLCSQSTIESLRIKRLVGKDISKIRRLKELKKLFIESGAGIEDVSPLADLSGLEVLILGESVKITDYSRLAALSELRVFSVCSYRTSVSSRLRMDSADFLDEMPNLGYVDLVDVKMIR